MRVIKPAWVEHSADKNARTPIYSISVHPDGTRLATAGMDRKIKIWSTLPILDADAAENPENSKLLCAMSEHTGSVLCVRWAHHGRFLASGSDDSLAVIWGLDSGSGGRLFGSNEVNVENWKPLTRLIAHQADIIDLAWSRDDSMLASVGLDGKLWIWDGSTFERIRGIDAHDGFVKGVCWDPAGHFLATQSDDKTVKIWKTTTWELIKTVTEPFADSGTTTFFRRLSWSPDGAFIAASNAKNGPVFVAAVIERNEPWDSAISFVGHANTIQVASFNPRLFFAPGDARAMANASSIVALGANDFSISIWRNTLHHPLLVLHDIFGRELLDLCWSDDGLSLYGCSHDGTICAVNFKSHELPDLGEPEDTINVLKEIGYNPVERVVDLSVLASLNQSSTGNPPVENTLQPRRKRQGDARRIVKRDEPSSNQNGFGFGSTQASSSRTGLQPPSREPISTPPVPPPPQSAAASAFAEAPLQPLDTDTASQAQASRNMMFQDANSAFGYDDVARIPAKRKASMHEERAPKGRMLGTSKPAGEVHEIRPIRAAMGGATLASVVGKRTLAAPAIQSALREYSRDGGDEKEKEKDKMYVEANNAIEAGIKNKVTCSVGGQDAWIDYVPSPVMRVVFTSVYAAVGCEDGNVVVYSIAGRHLFSVKCAAPIAHLAGSKQMLAVLTTGCELHVYDVRSSRSLFPPTSMAHILDSLDEDAAIDLHSFAVRANGTPVLVTTAPAAYLYDRTKSAFVPLVTRFQLSGSPLFTTTSRSRHSHAHAHATAFGSTSDRDPSVVLANAASSASPVDQVEAQVLEIYRRTGANASGSGSGSASGSEGGAGGAEWWDVAMTLQHVEMRLKAAEVLGSKEEYKGFIKDYAKKLGVEGFRARAEEIVRELVGPIYYIPGRSTSWEPEIMGIQKRDLAKMVLGAVGASTGMSNFAAEWSAVLKKMNEDDRQWGE